MTWDEIVGHEGTLEPLRRALDEERLHHSLLFHGPDGVGKRLAAFTLAAAMQCADGTGCGNCSPCRRVLQGYEQTRLKDRSQRRAPAFHADVLFYPARRKQIQIDQIQDLCREAGYRPYEGRRRVFLVDPADRMNREAANAILKTLEEPPPSAVLILITAHPQGLLPTLRSRCQDVRFSPLPPAELAGLLERRGHDAGESARLARLAQGSVGRALTIDLERHDALCSGLLDVLEAGARGQGTGAALALAEEIGADGASFEEAVSVLSALLRDVALLHQGSDPETVIHADLTGRLTPLAARLGERAPDEVRRLAEAVRRVRGNVNPRLAAEAILLGLATEPTG